MAVYKDRMRCLGSFQSLDMTNKEDRLISTERSEPLSFRPSAATSVISTERSEWRNLKHYIKQQNIMKKILFFSCIAAALLSFVGCEETGNDYEGTNYIYLESLGGNTTVWEQDETPLAVTVMLTSALSEDLNLTFAVEGTEGVLDIEGNPVTIKAGGKTASFAIVSKNADKVTSVENFKVVLDAATVLPDKVQLKEGFSFVVRSAAVSALTDAQKNIVEAYKTATDIDLSKYLGVVDVSTVITGTDPDSGEPLDPQTVTGKTIITLSESATAEIPVLKMIVNPMGIQDYMYAAFNSATIENESWLEYPNSIALMESIGWNDPAQETFSMSLDGITLNQDKTVSFLGTLIDDWEDERVTVPFAYDFSAYNREKAATANGTLGFERTDVDEDGKIELDDSNSNPDYHLNLYDTTEEYIIEDEYEGETWVKASATISETSLSFTFAIQVRYEDYDYTRFVVTYTPNN